MAQSIIQRALAAHPNWSGRPAATRAQQGVGRAGSSLLGLSGGGGPHSGPGASNTLTQTSGPAPAAPQDTTVQPFLTPAQQEALGKWNITYADDLSKLASNDTTALNTQTTKTAAENLNFATKNDTTDQAMAARGMFQSGIRTTALNDLAVTHAAALNMINTNYNTTIQNDQTNRQDLSGTNDTMQTYYQGLSVDNAQSITPTVPPPSTTTNPPAPAPTPAPAAPAAPVAGQHAALANPAHPSHGIQLGNHAGITTTSIAASASRRAGNPKPPGSGTGLNLSGALGTFGKVGAPQ